MKPILPSALKRLLAIPVMLSMLPPAAFAIDVRLCTQFGAIDVSIEDRAAPRHAANFLAYVESGFYDGTVIHRVVPGSMVQGGSFDSALERQPADDPVANESFNGLSNRRGTLAAARSEDPDSATSQFFFNLADNRHLDASAGVPGYTVFGRVTAGLEVLDEISELPSRRVGDLTDVPMPLVELQSAVRLEDGPFVGVSIERDAATITADLNMARARSDAAGVLDAIDALKRSCAPLTGTQRIVEAEAAISLSRFERARFGLERFLATASAFDPARASAERLFNGLPTTARNRNVDELIGHCRRPVAPSVPNGRFTELATMRSVEGAVLRFRQIGELYLTCITQLIDRAELNETELLEITERHNEMVIELTAVAMRFNRAVRNYQSAQGNGFGLN